MLIVWALLSNEFSYWISSFRSDWMENLVLVVKPNKACLSQVPTVRHTQIVFLLPFDFQSLDFELGLYVVQMTLSVEFFGYRNIRFILSQHKHKNIHFMAVFFLYRCSTNDMISTEATTEIRLTEINYNDIRFSVRRLKMWCVQNI